MNSYLRYKANKEKEINNFPMFFAFSNEQFEKSMTKAGLTIADTDKIVSIGAGGFVRKTDSQNLIDLLFKHEKELEKLIAEDSTGDGFIFDMFDYELSNHEYCISYDIEPTLDALGFSFEQINADERLKHGLDKARNAQFEQ